MLTKEVEQRDVLQKLEIVEKALPKIKRLAEEGNIITIPQKGTAIIDSLTEGVFEVSVRETTVSFRLCRYDLLDRKPPSRLKQLFTGLVKTLHA